MDLTKTGTEQLYPLGTRCPDPHGGRPWTYVKMVSPDSTQPKIVPDCSESERMQNDTLRNQEYAR